MSAAAIVLSAISPVRIVSAAISAVVMVEAAMFPAVMVLAAIGYLSEKNKIDTNLNEIKDYCQKYPDFLTDPITDEIIFKSFEIDDIPELHDRIIAGTAHSRNLEIITNDPVII